MVALEGAHQKTFHRRCGPFDGHHVDPLLTSHRIYYAYESIRSGLKAVNVQAGATRNGRVRH